MKTLSEMVREAGLPEAWISKNGVLSWKQLKRFSKLVRDDEREKCIQAAEVAVSLLNDPITAIRARRSP